MISAPQATPFGARVVGFPTGLTGTARVRLLDNVGGTTLAATTVGITESPAGSGSYIAAPTAPGTAGEYAVFWDTGAVGPSTTASSPLFVAASVLALAETISPSLPFESTVENMPTGLAGTIGVRILNNITGATTVARTTTGILEFPTGSGNYTKTLTAPAAEGYYSAFWDTGTVSPTTTAAEDLNVFTVVVGGSLPSGFDLCTLADVRAFLELPTSDTSRDGRIQTAITGGSQHIISEFEREFAPATVSEVRTIRLDPARRLNGSVLVDLAPYDVRTVSLLRLNPEATSPTTLTPTTDYMLMPVDTPQGVYTSLRLSNSLTFSSSLYTSYGFCQAEITGAWGFASVPTDVRDACVLTVASALRRDVPAFQIDELEDPRGMAPDPAFVYSIPGAAWKKLMPYKRHAGVF